jgi:hypothetical protein
MSPMPSKHTTKEELAETNFDMKCTEKEGIVTCKIVAFDKAGNMNVKATIEAPLSIFAEIYKEGIDF